MTSNTNDYLTINYTLYLLMLLNTFYNLVNIQNSFQKTIHSKPLNSSNKYSVDILNEFLIIMLIFQ